MHNEEEEDEDEDDILDELILEPFDYTANQMKEFFLKYQKEVSEGIHQTFNCDIDNLIATANSGPDSCWLQIMQNGKLQGMCVYNLDLTQYAFRRINILHISMKQMP